MKLYLSNQEIVLAIHNYLIQHRNCERDRNETPSFQVTTDNRGLLMVEVDGYNQKIKNPVHNQPDDVVEQENAPTTDEEKNQQG